MEFKKLLDDEYSCIDSLSSSSSSAAAINDSTETSTSSFSSEMADDASSSSSSSSSSPPPGPLYELAELMAQLPIKRGLSKFYNGKSQTFGSLANVKSLEDLAKKEGTNCDSSISKRMKSCKSYGGNLNQHHHHHHIIRFGPKPLITKKSPKTNPAAATKVGANMVLNCCCTTN